MKRIALLSFLAVGITDLLAIALDLEMVHQLAKPLICLSLLAYYLISVKSKGGIFSAPVVYALIFCCAGDVLLLWQVQTNFFLLGLSAFLVGHVLYIFAYHRHSWAVDSGLLGTQKVRFSLPVVLYGTGLLVIMYDRLGGFRIPVMVYAIVIIVMVMQAIFRYGRTSGASFTSVLFGALLFLISDSLIALNKFYAPISNASLFIMLTYILAQILIVAGLINHPKEKAAPV